MGLAQNVRDYLETKYNTTTSTGSYLGVDKFYRAIKTEGKIKVTRKQVEDFLKTQTEYTIHKGVRRKFPRRRAIIPYIGYMIEVDCAYMLQYKDKNSGYGYFLVAIDTFSRLAQTAPLKTLKGSEVSKTLEDLLTRFDKVERVRSDMGSEFKSKITQSMLKRLNIKHFYSGNETKCFFAERLIRTIKSIMYRYMTSKNSHTWIDQLQNITANYNNTYHRSIKCTPASVKIGDEHHLSKLMYDTPTTSTATTGFKYELNDTVRISILKSSFMRIFDEQWSREYFLISGREIKQGIPVYTLKDLQNEPLNSTYYTHELQKIITDDKRDNYIIEKVLQRRRGKCLVRWLGWPIKFATWIDCSSIDEYNKSPKTAH